MRIAEHEARIRTMLRKARVDSPDLCARLLTAHAACLDRISYILAWNQELEPDQAAHLEEIAQRRASGEPLAYLLGSKEFYGRDFLVSSATLVPRPETELLIEAALQKLPATDVFFCDMGCGSGCIGLTLLLERPRWHGVLADYSLDALAIAACNNKRHNQNASLIANNLFKPCFRPDIFDLFISNPPYISRQEQALVMDETFKFEPHTAIFSDCDGLTHLKGVVEMGAYALKTGGWIMLEHGATQRQAVYELLTSNGFDGIEARNDLARLPRCVIGKKQGGQNG